MIPSKRRWILAIAAIVVVAVVGFVVFREAPKDDLPRLVVLGQEERNGQKVVAFRFEAPKHSKAALTLMFSMSLSTRDKPQPLSVWPGGIGDFRAGEQKQFVIVRGMLLEAGQSNDFVGQSPVDDVWRIRCQVCVEKGVGSWKDMWDRVRLCWRYKTLSALVQKGFTSWVDVESEPITNSVPRTADALRP